MADKVVRIKGIGLIEHRMDRDKVVLLVTGNCDRMGAKKVRAELALDAHDVRRVVSTLRVGAKRHAEVWAETVAALGAEG